MAIIRKIISLLLILALLALCGASAEVSIQLPAKLRVIGAESFAGFSDMEHVVLPEGVTEIHSRAFADTGLTEITLPSSLTYIADDAFENAPLASVNAEVGSCGYAWAVVHGFITPSAALTAEIIATAETARPGDTVSWVVTTGNTLGQCRFTFRVYSGDTLIAEANSAENVFSYAFAAPGSYYIVCDVADDLDQISVRSAHVLVGTAQQMSGHMVCDRTLASVGDTVNWTTFAFGGSGVYSYDYEVYRNGSRVYAASSSGSALTYTFSNTGTYYARCKVSDGAETLDITGATIEVASGQRLTGQLICDVGAAQVGDTATWTATITGGAGKYSYIYRIYRDGELMHTTPSVEDSVLIYRFTRAGSYTVVCEVTDGAATQTFTSAAITVSASISDGGLGMTVDGDIERPAVGDTQTWYVVPSGGRSPYRYSYTLKRGTVTVASQEYGEKQSFVHTFFKPGDYTLNVKLRDASGKVSSEDLSFEVRASSASVSGVVRAYVDTDSSGVILENNAKTGHFELQIDNKTGKGVAFDNRLYNSPVFSFGTTNGGTVKVFDSDYINRANVKLYTFSFDTTPDKVDCLLYNVLPNQYLNIASESESGKVHIYDSKIAYTIRTDNCFTTLAAWCSDLGYNTLAEIVHKASSYTDYIAWRMYKKYGTHWTYVGQY